MKASVFKAVGQPWIVETRPDPTPGAGELVLKIGRCGICGSDLHFTSGEGRTMPSGSVLGHEYAGEVVAIGADVQGFRIGDQVAAMPYLGCGKCEACLAGDQLICTAGKTMYTNGFAEYALATSHNAVKLPSSLSAGDGALVEPLAVGIHGVRLAGPAARGRCLVLGAGSIGLAVIHALRGEGAQGVVAASRSSRRAALAMTLGADAFVETGAGEAERIAAALGGPPDVVFECIGAPGALDHTIRLVKPNGQVVSMGNCASPDPLSINAATFKQVRLVFSAGYSLGEFQAAADQLSAGRLEPRVLISDVVSLAGISAAVDQLRAGATQTKVQVDPWL